MNAQVAGGVIPLLFFYRRRAKHDFHISVNLALVDSNLIGRNSKVTQPGLPELGRQFLFGGSDKITAIPAADHPYGPPAQDPTDKAAAAIIIERLDLGAGEVSLEESLESAVPGGSILLLGGPVSNAYARPIFGTGEGSPLLSLAATKNALTLPITFDWRRQVSTGGEWGLVIEGRSASVRQRTDYLVLTSLPHVYSRDPQKLRLVVVSGAHRSGTRAVGLLLADAAKLEAIERKTRSLEAWQAVFPVDLGVRGEPISLGDGQVFEVLGKFDQIAHLLQGKAFLTDPFVRDGTPSLLGEKTSSEDGRLFDLRSERESRGIVEQEVTVSSPKPVASAGPGWRSGEASGGEAAGGKMQIRSFKGSETTTVHYSIINGLLETVHLEDKQGNIFDVDPADFDREVLRENLGFIPSIRGVL